MNKETIAAIISDRTMINKDGLVQNAEEVAKAIIDAIRPPVADIGAEIEAAPGHVKGVNGDYPEPLFTDEDLDRQGKALSDITMDLLWRLRKKWGHEPRKPKLSDASFIVERVLQNPEDQILDAKQYVWRRITPPDFQERSGNWLQKYVSDARNCFEPGGCTTCGGASVFREELIGRIAEIVGTAGSDQWGLNADGAKLLVDLMRELKPPEHPSWYGDSAIRATQRKWEKAVQLMIRDCWGVLGKTIVQDRLGQSWAALVAGRMIADEQARGA
jgi:hypothetical protein